MPTFWKCRFNKKEKRRQTGGIEQQGKEYADIKKAAELAAFFISKKALGDQTQPVGFGRPAILQAPLPGPDGNSS
jgi:hypothetical protein